MGVAEGIISWRINEARKNIERGRFKMNDDDLKHLFLNEQIPTPDDNARKWR